MKKKLILPFTSILAVGAMLIVGMGQACGRWETANVVPGSESSPSLNTSSDDPALIPNTATVALVYGKQILDHYTSCLGSGLASERTLAMYEAKKGTISETGSVSTLTAPMLMASTSIAGEVCKDLIEKERAAPRIFVGFNFAATSLPAQSSLQDAVRRIARSCWGRDEDTQESEIILGAVSTAFSGASGANTTHDAALFMCTTMMSSLDSMVLL